MKTRGKHTVYLVLTAVIWGLAFVAQATGGESLGAFPFNCFRYLLGVLVLLPVIRISRGNLSFDTETLKGGAVCGFFLAAASCLQQLGILLTEPGKAGFITAFYVILVPLFSVAFGKKLQPKIYPAILLGAVGLWLICVNGKMRFAEINRGDILCFFCAVLFAFQIMAVAHFAERTDCLKLAAVQFAAAFLFSAIPMLLTGLPTIRGFRQAWLPLLYVGLLSTGVAYTLQVVGQKGVHPALASLIMSLESCFSVLFSWLLLGSVLSIRELLGCGIMFAAIIIAEVL